MTDELTIYTDGASRGNPGKSAFGFAIYQDERAIKMQAQTIPFNTTNNVAEYMAMISALSYLSANVEKPAEANVLVVSDSQLIIRQMTGEYRVKDDKMKQLHFIANKLEENFKTVSHIHVSREHPTITIVDKLCNDALDNYPAFI